jgi:hypothetical protein
MREPPVPLTALSEDQRAQAHSRFTIIRPALEDGVAQAKGKHVHNFTASTIQWWVKRYCEKCLAGLADARVRSDKGKSRRLPGFSHQHRPRLHIDRNSIRRTDVHLGRAEGSVRGRLGCAP